MSQKIHHTPSSRFQSVKAVAELIEDGNSVKSACAKINVSPSNYRRWRDALIANPEFEQRKVIEMGSRRPKRFARQVSASTRQRIIDMANQHQHTSANSITQQLKDDGIDIGTAKVIEILKEEGLFGEIEVQNASGGYRRKRGLLKLCEKRQRTS
ncbi:MAG: transposase [Pseudomonadota bacterium]